MRLVATGDRRQARTCSTCRLPHGAAIFADDRHDGAKGIGCVTMRGRTPADDFLGPRVRSAARTRVAYVLLGGVGVRVSNGFSAICLPTYLRQKGAIVNQLYRGVPFYHIYASAAGPILLPAYLPT